MLVHCSLRQLSQSHLVLRAQLLLENLLGLTLMGHELRRAQLAMHKKSAASPSLTLMSPLSVQRLPSPQPQTRPPVPVKQCKLHQRQTRLGQCCRAMPAKLRRTEQLKQSKSRKGDLQKIQ